MISNSDAVAPVALYERNSTEEQKEAGTIQNQDNFLARYTDLHGLRVYDVYKDEGVSGTIPFDERPDGRRLLADARAGKFKQVIVYRVDRAARSLKVLLDVYERLDDLGVALRSATEPIDTGTPVGRFVFQLIGSMAELERSTILERTASGKRRAASESRWLGGVPPYGFRVAGGQYARRLVICEREAEVIRRIFRLYLDGLGTVGIAVLLNAEGVPSPNASRRADSDLKLPKSRWAKSEDWTPRWTFGTVAAILKDESYIGRFRHSRSHGGLDDSVCPAIVSAEVFEAAQRRMKENFIEATRNAKRFYLLRGQVRCGICRKVMVGISTTKGRKTPTKYYYYRCPDCRHAVRAEPLEEQTWAHIEAIARDPRGVIADLEARLAALQAPESEARAEQERIRANLARIDREAASILDYAGDPARREWIEAKLSRLAAEKKDQEAKLQQVFAQEQARQAQAQALIAVELYLNILNGRLDQIKTPERKREFVKGLDWRVTCWRDKQTGQVQKEISFQPLGLVQVLGLDGGTETDEWASATGRQHGAVLPPLVLPAP